jgi:hypothetical protein
MPYGLYLLYKYIERINRKEEKIRRYLSLFQNRLFCKRLLQFFGLEPAKLRFFKVAVPKTEVLEQPEVN